MKEFIRWSDISSVGINEIDDQHKELLNIFNELNETLGNEDRKAVIDKLVKYTIIHFATEEIVMNISNYPDIEEHKKQHKALNDTVCGYINKYEHDPDLTNHDLLLFLKQWLTEHTIESDKKFGAFLLNTKSNEKSWFRKTSRF